MERINPMPNIAICRLANDEATTSIDNKRTSAPNMNKLKLVKRCDPRRPVNGAAANIPRNDPKKFNENKVDFSSLVKPNACLKIIGSMICIVTRLSSNVRDPKTIIVADAVESEADVPGEDT